MLVLVGANCFFLWQLFWGPRNAANNSYYWCKDNKVSSSDLHADIHAENLASIQNLPTTRIYVEVMFLHSIIPPCLYLPLQSICTPEHPIVLYYTCDIYSFWQSAKRVLLLCHVVKVEIGLRADKFECFWCSFSSLATLFVDIYWG